MTVYRIVDRQGEDGAKIISPTSDERIASVTTSVGMALSVDQQQNERSLLNANRAPYRVKERGRNRIDLAEPIAVTSLIRGRAVRVA